jgi:hypothetical protein
VEVVQEILNDEARFHCQVFEMDVSIDLALEIGVWVDDSASTMVLEADHADCNHIGLTSTARKTMRAQ